MNNIKNWLIYKILREFKNFSRDFINFLYRFPFRLKFVITEHYGDKRLGIETSDVPCLKDVVGLYKDGNAYQPTPYQLLKKMADYLKLNPEDVFIDFGCGKGRVIFFMATQKLKKVVGIELRKELVDIAKRNFKNLKLNNTFVEIINEDVANFDIGDGTIFFMFNPFGTETLAKIVGKIKESLVTNPRKIRIVYYSPAHRNLLDAQNWLALEGIIDKARICVWHNRLPDNV